MDASTDTTRGRARRALLAGTFAIAVAVAMTWPLATGLGHLGRTQNSGDGRFAVWNVAWVAHALTTDPTGLFDANIFHPHRHALAYSEANVGAGTLAIPVWLLTRNPFAAHNSVVLFAFAASLLGAWLLARRLTGDGDAALAAAVIYAFCPYVMSHTAHIQLLMVAGIPISLLTLHQLVDAPSLGRGAALGLALAAQALSCAYYGIFVALIVGYATFFYAWTRRLWTTRAYWAAIAAAAVVSIVIVGPFFVPYIDVQQDKGFSRSLDDARAYSAYWRSYLASGAHAHAWLLRYLRDWNQEALFPGLLAIGLGIIGLVIAACRVDPPGNARRFSTDRETAIFYGSIGLIALWASLGPRAGLYTVLYHLVPVFSFLRAPGRMGILVVLVLAVFAAFALRHLLRHRPAGHRRALSLVAAAAIALELTMVPFDWRPASPIPRAYDLLASLPRGPVAEFPFFDRRIDFHIHTRYMLNSTRHWQPLLNGYSDHIPPDFRTLATVLASFPSRDAFAALRERRVRYLTINRGRDGYGPAAPEIEQRLLPFHPHLHELADDGVLVVYEIVSWPR